MNHFPAVGSNGETVVTRMNECLSTFTECIADSQLHICVADMPN